MSRDLLGLCTNAEKPVEVRLIKKNRATRTKTPQSGIGWRDGQPWNAAWRKLGVSALGAQATHGLRIFVRGSDRANSGGPAERARLLPETVSVPLDAARNKVISHLRQKMT
jgi:hypothetical protein